jgi:HEAT repeat protein
MQPDDLEWHLQVLTSPFGGEPHRRERDRSLEYLIAHAEEAHPRLLAMLRANPEALDAPALIEVLPAFARPESVPVLEALLSARRERTVSAAGEALGRHPSTEARDVLLQGLSSANTPTIDAAADGLMIRGDATACERLTALVGHPNPNTRYHVIRAAGALRCLGADVLSDLERREPDPDVRDLVRRIRGGVQ